MASWVRRHPAHFLNDILLEKPLSISQRRKPGSFSDCIRDTAHISFEYLRTLLRVVQRRDGQVGDGDVSRGRQRDQQHHEAPGLLQRQLQVMSLLLGQRGEIQLAAGQQRQQTQ